ncbi:MAG: hypothetical protein ACYC2H_11905 [Thermoplasmatota archaeon]
MVGSSRRVAILVASLLATPLLAGCAEAPEPPLEPVEPGWANDLPTQADVGGRTVSLSADAWRDADFEGILRGSGLLAMAVLTANGTDPFPAGVSVERAWFVRDGWAWNTTLRMLRHQDGAPPRLAQLASGGPRWPVGATLDLVALVQGPGNVTVLLAVKAVRIDGR